MGDAVRVPARRAAVTGLWLLAAVLVAQFVLAVAAASARHTSGFAAYYTSARLLREGADVSRFYDNRWFEMQVRRYTPDVGDLYHPNPPAAALLLWPLAGSGHAEARAIWTLCSVFLLAAMTGVFLRHLGLAGMTPAVVISALALYQPLRANFALGQAYVLLLGLLTLAWYGYRHGRDALLGVALALALVFKTAGVLLWPLLFWQRRWRAVAWGAGISVLLILASFPVVGTESWVTYVQQTPPRLLAEPALAVVPYQTVPGLFRHLFSSDPQWNPAPLWPMPQLAAVLPPAHLLLLLGLSCFRAPQRRPDSLTFAAFTVLSVVFSPVSLDYHYTLVLLPFALAASWTVRARPGRLSAFWLASAAALIALPLPYLDRRLEVGALALLAYPKLYGGLLLWGFLIVHAASGRSPSHRTTGR